MKELNFKDWLEEKGVDPFTFWKNCKKKHQKWCKDGPKPESRKTLHKKTVDMWLIDAFYWPNSIQKKSRFEWNLVYDAWKRDTYEAQINGTPIVFGFKSKKEK